METKKETKKDQGRVNYEDHSLKFLDWVDRLGFQRTFGGRLFNLLEEKFQIKKFSFVFLFSFILAYVLTFEVRTPGNYKVGDVAKVDVISPLSFEMVDEATTEEKRQRAEMEVPVIFDYDSGVFD